MQTQIILAGRMERQRSKEKTVDQHKLLTENIISNNSQGERQEML